MRLLFEKVVYKHIFNFLMENALIYKFQSGFLPGHSTTHQLIEHINEIFMALDHRELICLPLGNSCLKITFP
jgi:hypothetical protein